MTHHVIKKIQPESILIQAQAVTEHLRLFAELISLPGPLGYLQFEAEAFTDVVRPLKAGTSSDALAEWMDALFAEHIAALATPHFLTSLRHTLENFIGLPFVPEDHRAAVAAAITLTPHARLTPEALGQDAPALYVLFRVRVQEYLDTLRPLPR
jgi:hypothetical protein